MSIVLTPIREPTRQELLRTCSEQGGAVARFASPAKLTLADTDYFWSRWGRALSDHGYRKCMFEADVRQAIDTTQQWLAHDAPWSAVVDSHLTAIGPAVTLG
jgi:hypothetical protein